VTSWNKAAERIFGYTAPEMIGQSIMCLAVPGHGDEMMEILERIRRGERVDHYEAMRRHKDGAILHISLSVSPIYDGDGRLIGTSRVSRDITGAKKAEATLKQSEARLQELNAELLHVSRLSAMGQVAAKRAPTSNSLLAGKIQGISLGLASRPKRLRQIGQQFQHSTRKSPTRPNREFFAA
jgi:PAS domain S-box-containing protein